MSEIPQREVILSKAGELFHQRGYSSVSVDEIIAASGLSKAEFYRNYSGKSALGRAWLERLSKRMRLMHENFMDRLGDPERRLKKYFLSMSNWVESNGWRACQFANTAASIEAESEPEMMLLIDQCKRAQRDFFIDLVGTLVAEKEARRLGTAVFLLYSGAMTEAQNLKATWPFEEALSTAEELCGIR
jgi:AcrR family transcriptional regulator